MPTWAEIYRVIAPHGVVLKALLVPAASQEDYYQGILTEALGVGLQDRTLLLGLLWHAPHGEARHRPDRWDFLQEVAAKALERRGGGSRVADLPALTHMQKNGLPEPGTAMLTQELTRDSLGLSGSPGPSAPRGREENEPSGAGFNQSVSGQFFQLLAGLGERVIMESCRYEAMLAGLRPKAEDIHKLVADWQQCFPGASTGDKVESASPEGVAPMEFEWTSILSGEDHRKNQLQEIKTAAGDFLEKNPDLADNRDKIRMVLFCLKNYITINPECAQLTFREKLERAGALARDFLTRQGEP